MLQLWNIDVGLNVLLIAFYMETFLLAHALEVCASQEVVFMFLIAM